MAYTYRHGDRPLEGYTIQRAVGRGGFGEVYYAISDGGRELALKYLRENPNVELRGISHCMNLKSPHLVSIFDVKQNADGEYFVIMEYVSGPSLRDLLIAEPQGMGPQKAAFFVREIAKGLAYLHDQGIVHRDLKPANIFYDEGYVKIGDYGLSKFISVSRHSAQTTSVGTVHYMAPEVGSGNYQRGIDIYALGVMLYEMLLGKVPFEGSSMGEVLMKHLTEQPEVENLPAPFGKVIRKALAKDPKDRYQSVYEMVDDLLEVDDVKSSLAGFNPSTISMVERRGMSGVDSPAPSPNPAPHGPAVRRIPQGRGAFDLDAGQLPAKTARRMASIESKVEKKLRKLDAKHGGSRRKQAAGPIPPTQPARAPQPRSPHSNAPHSRGEVIQRVLLALALAVGLGVGLGFLVDAHEEGFASAIMGTIALAGSVAFGIRIIAWISKRTPQPRWLERICIAGPAAASVGIAMIPFSERSDDLALASWAALLVVAFFARWSDHVDSGSRGEMSIWKAAKVALFALIMVSIFGHNHHQWFNNAQALCAGVAAASSFVIQALAWLFPLEQWLYASQQARSDEPIITAAVGVVDLEPSRAPDERRDHGWGRKHRRQESVGEYDATDSAPGSDGYSFLIDGRPKRWLITRIIASLVLVAAIGGTIALIVGAASMGPEVYRHVHTEIQQDGRTVQIEHTLRDNDFKIPMIAGAAGLFGLALFAGRKTTRFQTGGIYRDTVRPILLAITMAGIAGSVTALVVARLNDGEAAAVLVGLVLSSMAFLFLLFKRGTRFVPEDFAHNHESANESAMAAVSE
ncbi:MAG: protein kinase [Phycisphaerales bacterium]|nr:protein kinase [Phycisphaerales bacterium]